MAQLLAQRLVLIGDERVRTGDDQGAFDAWSGALRADPTLVKVRQRTEAARDRLLGLAGTDG